MIKIILILIIILLGVFLPIIIVISNKKGGCNKPKVDCKSNKDCDEINGNVCRKGKCQPFYTGTSWRGWDHMPVFYHGASSCYYKDLDKAQLPDPYDKEYDNLLSFYCNPGKEDVKSLDDVKKGFGMINMEKFTGRFADPSCVVNISAEDLKDGNMGVKPKASQKMLWTAKQVKDYCPKTFPKPYFFSPNEHNLYWTDDLYDKTRKDGKYDCDLLICNDPNGKTGPKGPKGQVCRGNMETGGCVKGDTQHSQSFFDFTQSKTTDLLKDYYTDVQKAGMCKNSSNDFENLCINNENCGNEDCEDEDLVYGMFIDHTRDPHVEPGGYSAGECGKFPGWSNAHTQYINDQQQWWGTEKPIVVGEPRNLQAYGVFWENWWTMGHMHKDNLLGNICDAMRMSRVGKVLQQHVQSGGEIKTDGNNRYGDLITSLAAFLLSTNVNTYFAISPWWFWPAGGDSPKQCKSNYKTDKKSTGFNWLEEYNKKLGEPLENTQIRIDNNNQLYMRRIFKGDSNGDNINNCDNCTIVYFTILKSSKNSKNTNGAIKWADGTYSTTTQIANNNNLYNTLKNGFDNAKPYTWEQACGNIVSQYPYRMQDGDLPIQMDNDCKNITPDSMGRGNFNVIGDSYSEFSSTHQDCATKCQQDDKCKMFQFDTDNKKCSHYEYGSLPGKTDGNFCSGYSNPNY